jgi:hypothetical protein
VREIYSIAFLVGGYWDCLLGYFSCRFVQSMMPPLAPFGMGFPKTHAFLKIYLFSVDTWRDVAPGDDGHDSALAGATSGKRQS